jgi:hypothetical protein
LSPAHPFRFVITKSVPNLKFRSSTVNVSSTTQRPMNTSFWRLHAAAHFSPLPCSSPKTTDMIGFECC